MDYTIERLRTKKEVLAKLKELETGDTNELIFNYKTDNTNVYEGRGYYVVVTPEILKNILAKRKAKAHVYDNYKSFLRIGSAYDFAVIDGKAYYYNEKNSVQIKHILCSFFRMKKKKIIKCLGMCCIRILGEALEKI